MEIRVAVCDKEAQNREYLVANIHELPLDTSCTEFSNGYDLTELFEENDTAFDVVLINSHVLSRGDGMTVAKKIREHSLKAAIIIVSDCRDYYQEAFEVFAMNYLINPVSYRDIEKCFTFYTKNNGTDRRASWLVKSCSGHWHRVYCRDILYIESENREFIVHMVNGDPITSYGKLSDIVDQLPRENIVRCHQSYIVNMFYVDEMQTNAFVIRDTSIPISRKYQKIIKEQYYTYMFSRM